jgi:hypothetical protein
MLSPAPGRPSGARTRFGCSVSSKMSNGDFDDLEGLVDWWRLIVVCEAL